MVRSIAIVLGMLLWAGSALAQQSGIQRTPVIQQDGPPGYQIIVVDLDFQPNARETRHTHPGAVTVYVAEGTATLEHEGRPTTKYKAGEVFFVEPGKIHAASNEENAPLKLVATLVVEKGKPPTSPVP